MNNQKILTAGNTLKLKYYTADSVSRQPQVDTEHESLFSLRKNMYLQTVLWTTLVQAVQEMDLELSNPSLILHTDWRFEDAEKHNCFFPLKKIFVTLWLQLTMQKLSHLRKTAYSQRSSQRTDNKTSYLQPSKLSLCNILPEARLPLSHPEPEHWVDEIDAGSCTGAYTHDEVAADS